VDGGFTLLEVLTGIAFVSVVFVALYLGFAQGFAVIQLARENLRATQVLQEKTETIRLYTWDQINTPGYIPSSFTAPFYPVGQTNRVGLTYAGTVQITDPTLSETYAGDLKQVTVEVTWTSGEVLRRRQMHTYVSRYGLQNYVY
jgi:hypothetical protein